MSEAKVVLAGQVIVEKPSVIEDFKVTRRDILDMVAEDLAEDARKRLVDFDKETEEALEKQYPEPEPMDYVECAYRAASGSMNASTDVNYRNRALWRVELNFDLKPEDLPRKAVVRAEYEKQRAALREPLQDEYNFLTGDKKRLKNELIRRQLTESDEGSRVLSTVTEMRQKLAADLKQKRQALQLEAGGNPKGK
jgi:hypothetical protein